MNPFTQSTVARPLSKVQVVHQRQPRGLPSKWLLAGSLVATTLLLPAQGYATDVNQANLEQLKIVRGIGPKTANLILEERERGGPYESFADLADRVKGIGPKKAIALQQAGLTVGIPAGSVVTPSAATSVRSKQGR